MFWIWLRDRWRSVVYWMGAWIPVLLLIVAPMHDDDFNHTRWWYLVLVIIAFYVVSFLVSLARWIYRQEREHARELAAEAGEGRTSDGRRREDQDAGRLGG